MPEITAVIFMTDNIRTWVSGLSIIQMDVMEGHNPNRIHISEMPKNTGMCTGVIRRGKTTILSFDKGYLLFSYQLSGKIILDSSSRQPHTRVVIKLSNGKKLLWIDKINFGSIHWFTNLSNLKNKQQNLGPEFWPIQKSGEWWKNICNSKSAIHKVLIDQKRVAGIGNIIAIETLHRSGIHPSKPANTISPIQWDKLAKSIRMVVKESQDQHNALREKQIKQGIFNGNLDFVSEGHTRAEGYQIYGREHEDCPQCKKASIIKIRLAGRPIYLCPKCQY